MKELTLESINRHVAKVDNLLRTIEDKEQTTRRINSLTYQYSLLCIQHLAGEHNTELSKKAEEQIHFMHRLKDAFVESDLRPRGDNIKADELFLALDDKEWVLQQLHSTIYQYGTLMIKSLGDERNHQMALNAIDHLHFLNELIASLEVLEISLLLLKE